MDSSWKNLQIRMEAAWNMRTTPKTKRPKTGDIISSAHSLDWNKKKVRQLQQQWNDEVTKLVADRNKAISDVMVDILTLIRMDIKSASSVLISHEAAKLLWEKAYDDFVRCVNEKVDWSNLFTRMGEMENEAISDAIDSVAREKGVKLEDE